MISITTKLIVTFLGVGYSPICPGTMASIATLPLWLLIIFIIRYFNVKIPSIPIICIITIIYLIGYDRTKKYVAENKLDDPGEVVIDEVVGQLLSFFISSFFIYFIEGDIDLQIMTSNNKLIFFLLLMVLPIIFFRLFDIIKPWIIGKIDSNVKSAFGIMLDDVFAGIFAGIVDIVLIIFIIKFYL